MSTPFGPPHTLKQALALQAAKRQFLLREAKRHGMTLKVIALPRVRSANYKGLPWKGGTT